MYALGITILQLQRIKLIRLELRVYRKSSRVSQAIIDALQTLRNQAQVCYLTDPFTQRLPISSEFWLRISFEFVQKHSSLRFLNSRCSLFWRVQVFRCQSDVELLLINSSHLLHPPSFSLSFSSLFVIINIPLLSSPFFCISRRNSFERNRERNNTRHGTWILLTNVIVSDDH